MINFHPPLTTLPFALVVSVAVLEGIRIVRDTVAIRAAIGINLILATIGVVLAFVSGYQANDLANQTFTINDELISAHHFYGRLLLFAIFPCLVLSIVRDLARFNRKVFVTLYFLSLVVVLGLVLFTGFLGGELVFKHGAAVSAHPVSKETP